MINKRVDIKVIMQDPAMRARLLAKMVRATIAVGRDNTKVVQKDNDDDKTTIKR